MAPEQFDAMIAKLAAGTANAADIEALRLALTTNGLSALQLGKYNINISQGQNVQIGDSLYFPALNDEAMQAIAHHIVQKLQASPQPASSPTKSVDALVQQVRSRLHDDIQRLHGTMPLWGVDHWVPLGELFVDVNILEELSSSRRSELADLWQDFNKNPSYRSLDRIGLGGERERVSGLEVLAKHTHLMVVGKPGSGKTTYLQRVVTECNAGNLQAHKIAVLIRLREFIEDGRDIGYSLERYLERCWQLAATETQLVLNQGRSLLLLDGLDEVTGDDGKTITKQIKQFARAYPQVQMAVTCRTQSQESRFERFDYVEVADFNEPQVRAFAEHWFQTVCADRGAGQAKAQVFLDQLFREENKPIRELAITPILLSLTCAVFEQKQAFYSKRSKLYEEGLELLLEQWDKSREIERDELYRDLSVERKLELLSYLAVKKFEQEQYVLFEQMELEGYIAEFLGIGLRESRAVLRAIEAQHGLLIERSREVWSFSHLTFQEYLVANALTKRYNSANLTSQEKQSKTLKYITQIYWQEVFLMTSIMLENPYYLLGDMQVGINESIKSDADIQIFMKWIYQKSCSIDLYGKSMALRAFYFAWLDGYRCEAIRNESYDFVMIYDGFSHLNFRSNSPESEYPKLGSPVNFDLSLYLGLDLGIGTRGYDSCSIDSISKLLKPVLEGTIESNKILEVRITFCMKVVIDIADNLSQGSIYGGDSSYDAIDTFNFYLKHITDNICKLCPKLRAELQDINQQIPKLGYSHDKLIRESNREILKKFWKTNGKRLAMQLRRSFINSWQVGYDWQFNKIQKEKLSKYYYASKLLLACLSQIKIGISEKQDMKERLLLPIAEIEKRKREKAE